MTKKKTFTEWFDPHNIEHIKAYRHLQQEGAWPSTFIKPSSALLETNWQILLAFKMANEWVKWKLQEGGNI